MRRVRNLVAGATLVAAAALTVGGHAAYAADGQQANPAAAPQGGQATHHMTDGAKPPGAGQAQNQVATQPQAPQPHQGGATGQAPAAPSHQAPNEHKEAPGTDKEPHGGPHTGGGAGTHTNTDLAIGGALLVTGLGAAAALRRRGRGIGAA